MISGDLNGDGAVNLADYTLWRDNLGRVDATGVVDAADYLKWRNNFGSVMAFSGNLEQHAVPEPGAWAVILSIGVALLGGLRSV